jgi:hypothetical protein
MKIARRRPLRLFPRLMLNCAALVCALVLPLSAQTTAPASAPTSVPPTSAPQAPTVPTDLRPILSLNSPWRFEVGDDLEWAESAFDDSKWQPVTLGDSLAAQGFDTYSGYAWYRLKLQPEQFAQFADPAAHGGLELLITGNSVGQLDVFVNGVEAAHTRGMTEQPALYQSPPFVVPLPAQSAKGPIVIAIRSWSAAPYTVSRGLLTRVELGVHDDIADRLAVAIDRQWNERVTAALLVTFLFLCVALLGAALYWAQRHHSEYLWLALLCLSVAADAAAEAAFGLGVVSASFEHIFSSIAGRVFMAITLEFVLRFTASPPGRIVRGVQFGVLVLPILGITGWEQIYDILAVAAEVIFCALVCVLLFRAWRRGRQEAGVMLLPFFLAAIADSADTVFDYVVSRHWLPEQFAAHHFHLGPIAFGTGAIAYIVFLVSLVAVILYRFIRISEIEQRSTAEISAARSVQALLIPTQLPSNKNFMLESAYLPVNGVGGDFFQVLPLKDDSLLIVVGDVSGKGLQAAMNSSTLVGALRNELSHDPAIVLDHLNHVLLGAVSTPGAVPGLDSAPCFATCLCARVYADGTLTIANAGHLSPYRDGRELELPPGLPLGVIADSQYEQTTFQLNRGDRLVFLSDGVVEATNSDGELFGFERTQQVSHEPARYIAQTAQRFGQTDDITVVSLYVASRAAHPANEQALQTS